MSPPPRFHVRLLLVDDVTVFVEGKGPLQGFLGGLIGENVHAKTKFNPVLQVQGLIVAVLSVREETRLEVDDLPLLVV